MIMGKPTGFMEFDRIDERKRSPSNRIKDWDEFVIELDEPTLQKQGARCMDCGVPFCHTGELVQGRATGCPINNLIPEWNDLVYQGHWREALERLHQTNNFPEFTGRVCPAPCEGSCVLGINEPPVTIKSIERTIIDRGFERGWVRARVPAARTGKTVAVVGSGPAGLAAADQLNQAGHQVTVFERSDRIGGLLMYGIPNMKLPKTIVQRRIDLLSEEGIEFRSNTDVGIDIGAEEIKSTFDATIICVGATQPRDLKIPGRSLEGVHFAMDYLTQSTSALTGGQTPEIHAHEKNVVVIGGGDTGTDCIGTALRQGCKSLVNLEIVPRPPDSRAENNPWPQWPLIFRSDYGHAEAKARFGRDPRQFAVETVEFVADKGWQLTGLKIRSVDWSTERPGVAPFSPVVESERMLPADLVFLALGFEGPEPFLAEQFGLETGTRTNILANTTDYETSQPGVFAAGDCRRGQSLVVWAIREGRQAAAVCDQYLLQTATV
jgi:glutamate synthase (NADPH/NADH) small chain